MPTYDLWYAQEHLVELFHRARQGQEVVIVREDGRACELTPLAEVPAKEMSSLWADIPEEPETAPGDPIPA